MPGGISAFVMLLRPLIPSAFQQKSLHSVRRARASNATYFKLISASNGHSCDADSHQKSSRASACALPNRAPPVALLCQTTLENAFACGLPLNQAYVSQCMQTSSLLVAGAHDCNKGAGGRCQKNTNSKNTRALCVDPDSERGSTYHASNSVTRSIAVEWKEVESIQHAFTQPRLLLLTCLRIGYSLRAASLSFTRLQLPDTPGKILLPFTQTT